MKMKALLSSLIIASGIALAPQMSTAADSPDIEKRLEQRLDKLKTELDINAEQEQELRDALSVSNEKKRAVFEKYGIEPGKRKGREQKSKLSRDDRKALRSEMKTIKEETDTEISGILSDSQMEKFRKMKKEKKQHRRSQHKSN